MDSADLRALQAPIKAKYRDDPASAVFTLRAKGEIGSENLTCKVETGRGLVEAGLHEATGGDGSWACSGDMLLEALVGCAGVTLRAVATSMGLEVPGGTISAEADLDFRGTLGVDKTAPVGFRNVRLRFDLRTTADPDQVAKLIQLTERYCVVYQTLVHPPQIEVGYEVAGVR